VWCRKTALTVRVQVARSRTMPSLTRHAFRLMTGAAGSRGRPLLELAHGRPEDAGPEYEAGVAHKAGRLAHCRLRPGQPQVCVPSRAASHDADALVRSVQRRWFAVTGAPSTTLRS
jgi:hypothetical protein